jgi:hypothetical protein
MIGTLVLIAIFSGPEKKGASRLRKIVQNFELAGDV